MHLKAANMNRGGWAKGVAATTRQAASLARTEINLGRHEVVRSGADHGGLTPRTSGHGEHADPWLWPRKSSTEDAQS